MSDPYKDRYDPDDRERPPDRSGDPDDRDRRGPDDDDRRPSRRRYRDDIDDDQPRRYRDDDDYDDRPRRRKSSMPGWAIALIVVAVLGMCMIPIGIGLLLPAVQQVRVAAARVSSSNNLKQMGLAMHSYSDAYGTLPPAAISDKKGKPLLSWRVALLPFVEHQQLYNQFRLDEPWDGPNNIKLLSLMPKIYAAPGGDAASVGYNTRYRVFHGKGAAFDGTAGLPLKAITDGLDNTLLIVEAAEAVPWTKPDELEYSPRAPLPRLSGAWSNKGEFLVCMADGSVRLIKTGVSEQDVRAAIVIDDGQIPGPEFRQNPR